MGPDMFDRWQLVDVAFRECPIVNLRHLVPFKSCSSLAHVLAAPWIFPTILYLLLKKVNHSLSTVLDWSGRSAQSGRQSSGFKDD